MSAPGLLISVLATASAAVPAQVDSLGATHNLHEVVVTGSNDAVGRNLLPYTVSTIGDAQLQATGSTQLLSAVSGLVPSLFVSERNIFGFGISNGGSGGIKIRGVGGSPTNAVLMMVDGQPQFAGVFSHSVSDFYQTEYVDRVEVLRGPASVLYGSNAMGGVINVITKNSDRRGVRTTLTSEYGSYNTWLTSLTNTTRFGGFSSLVSLGYDRTDGVRKNFDFNQANGYIKAGYDFSPQWQVRADYSLMQFIGNDPIYYRLDHPDATDDHIYHQKVIRGEASAMAVNRYECTNGAIRAYYSYGHHIVDDPNHFRSLDDRAGIIAYQNFTAWKGSNATVGFDFDRYTGKVPVSGGRRGTLATMERHAIVEYSPYVTLTQNLWGERIVLNAGVRMANSNRFRTQWVPQAGFVLHPFESWMLKGSVAKGYRNPSFRELYLYMTANPELKPESMMNYELTLGKSLGRWLDIDVTAYFSKGKDMIQIVRQKNVNTGRFVNKGIEVSARSHPLDCLQLRATYSYLHTSLDNLTGAPKNQYYLGVGWDAFKGFHLDAELKGVGGLFVDKSVMNQSYVTVNLRPSYKIIRQLEIFVNLDNITNTNYVINYGYPMPRFTATGGFKLTL